MRSGGADAGGCDSDGVASFDGSAQKMRPAGLLLAGMAREADGQRTFGELREAFQTALGFGEIVEAMQTLAAVLQFGGGLRAAQHENGEQRRFAAAEIEGFRKPLSIFGDAATAGEHGGEMFGAEQFEGAENGVFVVFDHGHAAGFLIAGGGERVERQRIGFGGDGFFFKQGAQHARLPRIEEKLHGFKITAATGRRRV